jgi:PAS domain S-box-containing protein
MSIRKNFGVLFFLLIHITWNAYSQSPTSNILSIEADFDKIALSKIALFFPEKNQNLSIEAVKALNDKEFTQFYNTNTPSQSHSFWLKLKIQNNNKESQKIIFCFDEFDWVKVYQFLDTGFVASYEGGVLNPAKQKIFTRGLAWNEVDLATQKTYTFFIKVQQKSSYGKYFGFNFFNGSYIYSYAQYEKIKEYQIWFYVIIGSLAGISIFCFLIALFYRSRTNYYLSLICVFAMTYGFFSSGIIYTYFEFQQLDWLRKFYHLSIVLFFVSINVFYQRFYSLKKHEDIIWFRIFGGFNGLWLVNGIIILLEFWSFAYPLLNFASTLQTLFFILFSISHYRLNPSSNRFILLSGIVLFIGVTYNLSQLLFGFDFQLTKPVSFIFILLFLLTIGLAIVEKTAYIKSVKDQLQEKLLTTEKDQNEKLEKLVEVRTLELSQKNEELEKQKIEISEKANKLNTLTEEIKNINNSLENQILERTLELQKNYDKLAESEKRFQYAVEASNNVIMDWNANKNETYFSPQSYSLLGFEPEDFAPTHENWTKLVHPDDKEAIVLAFKNLFFDEKGQYEIEYRMQTKSGHYIWLLERASVVERGINHIPTRIVGTRVDISNLKLAQEKIALTYQEFQNIQNALDESVLVAIFDLRGVIKKVNDLFCNIAECESTDLVGKHFLRYTSSYHNTIFFKYLHKTIEGGFIWRGDIKCKNRHQHNYWIEAVINPLYDANNEIKEYLLIGQEITARKNIAEERRKLIEDLTRYNNDLEQFAYITSHNLRAPIASILGLVSIFDQDSPGSVINKDVIKRLEIAAQDMDVTFKDINQILAAREQIEEVKEEISLSQLLNNIKNNFSNQIRSSQAEILGDFNVVETIYSIKSYIESIFFNLVSNALKYRSPKRKPLIKISTNIVERYVIISFSDNGLGIDLKKHGDKVFGLYKRFHFHTGGKGLGLHLVKTQVEALGGKIEVKSTEDKGTTFIIYLNRDLQNPTNRISL